MSMYKDLWGDWYDILKPLKSQTDKILNTVFQETKVGKTICPKPNRMFRAFTECPVSDFRLLIVGQDPYPSIVNGERVADGLAFSCGNTNIAQPSLKVIQDCIWKGAEPQGSEFGIDEVTDLTEWANQGVLLLNSSLTCIAGISGSHEVLWKEWTKAALQLITKDTNPVVFLMGAKAKSFKSYCRSDRIITSPHPASESYGSTTFSDGQYFQIVNKMLQDRGQLPINWTPLPF